MKRGRAGSRWLAYSVLLLGFLGLMGLGGGVASSTPGQLWVDDDPGCGGHSPCFSSIQAAVDAAANWALIRVRPGSYEESVTITKPVNLMGEVGGGQVLVSSPDPERPVIQVIGVGAVLQNLTITGGLQGLLLQSSSASIEFNRIIGNRDAGVLVKGGDPLLRRNEIGWTKGICHGPPCNIFTWEGGDGIRVTGLQGSGLGPRIIGNTISHNHRWGIRLLGPEEGTPSKIPQVEIEQNQISNNGAAPFYGGGISMDGVVSASIEKNQIEVDSVGILSGSQIASPVDLIIKRNRISGTDTGIVVNNSLRVYLGYNQLLNNDFEAIYLEDVKQAEVVYNVIQGNSSGLRVEGLLADGQLAIRYNKIWGNEEYGLFLRNMSAGGKVEIYRNEILTSGWGVWLLNAEAMTTMEQNTIEGNKHGVVVDRSRVMLNENRIVRNEGWGVVLSKDTFEIRIPEETPECLSGEIDWSVWDVRGTANEMYDNGKGNLCPEDYSWPENFVKETGGAGG